MGDDGGTFECAICADTLEKAQFVVMGECGHGFCASCTGRYVGEQVKTKGGTVLCAQCQQNCHVWYILGQLSSCGVEGVDEMSAKVIESTLMTNVKYCSNVSCGVAIEYVSVDCGTDWDGGEKFSCTFCKRVTCAKCGKEYEDGHKCNADDENAQAILAALVDLESWRRCPVCNTAIDRVAGCNEVVCVCGTTFCYECGVVFSMFEGDSKCLCKDSDPAPNVPMEAVAFPDQNQGVSTAEAGQDSSDQVGPS